jgi:hypothetical protein
LNKFLFFFSWITPFFINFSIIIILFFSLIFTYIFSLVLFIWFIDQFFSISLFLAVSLILLTIRFLNLILYWLI